MNTKLFSPPKGIRALLAATAVVLVCIHLVSSRPEPAPEVPVNTGWVTIDGRRYHFSEEGTLTNGWIMEGGSRCYCGPDGAALTGWQTIQGKQYYFGDDGLALTGWQTIDETQYYFLSDGALATGKTEIDGTQYMLSDDGQLRTGFVRHGDRLYFYKEDGTPVTGWFDHQGNRYYADTDGAIRTGWYKEGEYRYYFHPDGVMAVGENFVDGYPQYFTPKGIHITLVNPWHTLPADYKVDLVAIDDVYAVDRACYVSLMQMMAACEEADHEPMICSAYRSQADQQWLFDRKIRILMEDEGMDEETAREIGSMSVAVPGTSEHQLGLAVDIVSTDYYVLDDSQATTKTQQWLMEHCWEYGFILRYPDNTSEITGIIYEPWHYRYVGVDVAMELRDLGITLEEYLGAVSH